LESERNHPAALREPQADLIYQPQALQCFMQCKRQAFRDQGAGSTSRAGQGFQGANPDAQIQLSGNFE